jgi:hypothetical protein
MKNEPKDLLERLEDHERRLAALEKNYENDDGKDISENSSHHQIGDIMFNLNERNFVRQYGKGLNGPKKFVLLVAHEVQGSLDKSVEVSTIRSKWSRMTSKQLLGYEFNLQYPTTAKTNGWIDSKQKGEYHLLSGWQNIFPVND